MGFRVLILFVYAFAIFAGPVPLVLLLDQLTARGFSSWVERNIWVTVGVILTYSVGQLAILTRMASWAASFEAGRDVSPVSPQELQRRLLAINNPRLPFVVAVESKGGNRLVASWKIVDSKWIEVFAANGLKMQYELRMRLVPERKQVRAQDNFRRITYFAGLAGPGVKLSWSFSLFKGISFYQYERGRLYGLIYKDGELKIDDAYNYKFNISEVKNPIIEIITSSGWTFRPSVTF